MRSVIWTVVVVPAVAVVMEEVARVVAVDTAADAAVSFDPLRPLLTRVAYRMLGSVADAEDVVQDAFIRWLGTDRDAVREPAAFLRRTVTRLCLDQIKSARHSRETYVGPWLPDPLDGLGIQGSVNRAFAKLTAMVHGQPRIDEDPPLRTRLDDDEQDALTAGGKARGVRLEPVTQAVAGARADLGFLRLDPEAWAGAEAISVDYAVMERAANLVAVPFGAGWSDLGGWDAVAAEMTKDARGNDLEMPLIQYTPEQWAQLSSHQKTSIRKRRRGLSGDSSGGDQEQKCPRGGRGRGRGRGHGAGRDGLADPQRAGDQAADQRGAFVELDHAFGVQQHVAFLRRFVLEAVAGTPGRGFAAVETHRLIPLCQTRCSVTL